MTEEIKEQGMQRNREFGLSYFIDKTLRPVCKYAVAVVGVFAASYFVHSNITRYQEAVKEQQVVIDIQKTKIQKLERELSARANKMLNTQSKRTLKEQN